MLDFTRREMVVLLFLLVGFVGGMGVRMYRHRWAPLPEYKEEVSDYTTVEDRVDEKKQVEDFGGIGREPFHLNKATKAELESLPGIGPAIAARIIEYREQHGGFRTIEELAEVRGLGSKTVEKLKPFLKLQ
ncbi:MAG: helix-hairpin-helix domain-containing protein [bacterium]